MPRDPKRDHDLDPTGFHREPVHGSTYDRGLPFRETASGRDYPGSLQRRSLDRGYNRGPYNPPEHGDDGGNRSTGFELGANPNRGGLDLGGGLDEDWDRELGLRGPAESEGNQVYDEGAYRNARTAPYTEPSSVPGPFVGRGPKGFQYESERIRYSVCERLMLDGRLDASDIDIRVEEGEVTLEGTVESREAKRLAERVAESVQTVRDVHNRLRVRQEIAERIAGESGAAQV